MTFNPNKGHAPISSLGINSILVPTETLTLITVLCARQGIRVQDFILKALKTQLRKELKQTNEQFTIGS